MIRRESLYIGWRDVPFGRVPTLILRPAQLSNWARFFNIRFRLLSPIEY